VRIDDLITVVPFDAIFNDYARWAPTLVVRKPPDAQYPNLPGPIDYIVQTPINAGQKRTSGIDLDLRWRLPASAWGRWALSLSGTYLLTYKASEFEQVAPGTADNVNGYGALPRWRHYAALDWSNGAWGATLAHTYQNPYTETDLKSCDSSGTNCTGRRTVASNSVIDLLARFEGIRKLRTQLGVRNLFDRAPPSAYATGGFQVGYDPTYADSRGRMYFASLRWTLQ
jgi:iron complex outermembrane recepter protein